MPQPGSSAGLKKRAERNRHDRERHDPTEQPPIGICDCDEARGKKRGGDERGKRNR